MSTSTSSKAAFNPDLRAALVAMVRKRVPESEVEDIVQATLAEAIESPHAPKDSESLRRWIFGVAKNKVVDFHRKRGRESFDMPDVADDPAPHVEADLLRWAEKNLPEGEDAQKTLGWMLREGDGEKLESIAASEKLPAPRVRQRVSRLRRHLKTSWAREIGLLATLGVVITVALVVWLRKEPIGKDDPVARGEEIRRGALVKCNTAGTTGDASLWKECVQGLDDARRLHPAGDTRPEVTKAREDAAKALSPAPDPSPTTTQLPPEPAPSIVPNDSTNDSKMEAPKGKAKPVPTPMPTGSGFTPTPAPEKGSFRSPTKPGPSKSDFGGSLSDSDFAPSKDGASAPAQKNAAPASTEPTQQQMAPKPTTKKSAK